MQDKLEDRTKLRRESLKLQRLARMVDVVYAIKNHGLLFPEVTEQCAHRLRDRILAEPITACITIPFAFVGPISWEISWLSYPLVVWLVRRRRRAKRV